MLTELKRQKPWLKVPDKWALGNALRDLDNAHLSGTLSHGFCLFNSVNIFEV